MNRNIKIVYGFSEDKKRLTIELTDTTENSINKCISEYNLEEYNNSVELYNTMLERYDAEYDDDLANVLDELSNKLVKEGVYNE